MFLPTFINGLTIASYLFILAIGLNLSFGLLRIVNMNHGTFYLFGGFIGWNVLKITQNWYLGLLLAGVSMGIFAFLEEFLLLRRVRGKTTVETLITLSISIIFADLVILFWGGYPRQIRIPKLLQGQFTLGNFLVPKYNVFIILFALFIGITFWLLLKKTKIGMIIRAGVDNFEIVSTLGINVKMLFTGMFTVAGFMAGIAGMIGGTFQMIAPGEDFRVMINTLLVIIIGGMSSFEGSILGSLIIGMIFTFGSLLAPQFSLFFMFAPVAIVLTIRPQGLFGKRR
ncbi:MAG: branched-chain amino acid ABC transporter permease [Fusobacteriaceae bacterium]|jgi:branched-chain amino acid transport system permease protein|nr:branched-chain amino acid ABC transporter permease [Fusobacteriaceae bacterium]